ncbi:hypothetical protein [Trichormus sp. NMC-1]|uniref:hypothetical protein n=1 Tax=Trichormus sp. NMC-1 TaxID=1853259 RepID=UPI00115F96E7|nr:hypothetical protein [Trichormus sp. NMC-1]
MWGGAIAFCGCGSDRCFGDDGMRSLLEDDGMRSLICYYLETKLQIPSQLISDKNYYNENYC